MSTPQPARIQSLDEIHGLLRTAVRAKRPIAAMYGGHRRLLCPYVLGRNKLGHLQLLCYQYGGTSRSGLGHAGSPENWRCVAVNKLSRVEMINGPWRAAERHSRVQTCIETVELDAEKPDL